MAAVGLGYGSAGNVGGYFNGYGSASALGYGVTGTQGSSEGYSAYYADGYGGPTQQVSGLVGTFNPFEYLSDVTGKDLDSERKKNSRQPGLRQLLAAINSASGGDQDQVMQMVEQFVLDWNSDNGEALDPNNSKKDANTFKTQVDNLLHNFLTIDPNALGTPQQQQRMKIIDDVYSQLHKQDPGRYPGSLNNESLSEILDGLKNDPGAISRFMAYVTVKLKGAGLPVKSKTDDAGVPLHPIVTNGSGLGMQQVTMNFQNSELQAISALINTQKKSDAETAYNKIEKMLHPDGSKKIDPSLSQSTVQYLEYLLLYAGNNSGHSAAVQQAAKWLQDPANQGGNPPDPSMLSAAKQFQKYGSEQAGNQAAYDTYQKAVDLYNAALKETGSAQKEAMQQAVGILEGLEGNKTFMAQNGMGVKQMLAFALQSGGQASQSQIIQAFTAYKSAAIAAGKYDPSDGTDKYIDNMLSWAKVQGPAMQRYKEIVAASENPANSMLIGKYIGELQQLAQEYPGLVENAAYSGPDYNQTMVQLMEQDDQLAGTAPYLAKWKKELDSGMYGKPGSSSYQQALQYYNACYSQGQGDFLSNPAGHISSWLGQLFGGTGGGFVANAVAQGVTSPWMNTDKTTEINDNVIKSLLGETTSRFEGGISKASGSLTGADRRDYLAYLGEQKKADKRLEDLLNKYKSRLGRSINGISNPESIEDLKKKMEDKLRSLEREGLTDEEEAQKSKLASDLRDLRENENRAEHFKKKCEWVKQRADPAAAAGKIAAKEAKAFVELEKTTAQTAKSRAGYEHFANEYGYAASRVTGDPEASDPLQQAADKTMADLKAYKAAALKSPEEAEAAYDTMTQANLQEKTDLWKAAAENSEKNPKSTEAKAAFYDAALEKESAKQSAKAAAARYLDDTAPEGPWYGYGTTLVQYGKNTGTQVGTTQEDATPDSGSDGSTLVYGDAMVGASQGRVYDMVFANSWHSMEAIVGVQQREVAALAETGFQANTGEVTIDNQQVSLFGANGSVLAAVQESSDATLGLSIDGKKKDFLLNGRAGAFAGAEVQASGGATALGVGGNVMGQVGYGIGASANFKVGMEDGKFDFDIGGKLGLGVMLGFQVNITINVGQIAKEMDWVMGNSGGMWTGTKDLWSDAVHNKNALAGVGEGIVAAAGTVGSAIVGGVGTLGKWIGDGAKAIGNWFKSW